MLEESGDDGVEGIFGLCIGLLLAQLVTENRFMIPPSPVRLGINGEAIWAPREGLIVAGWADDLTVEEIDEGRICSFCRKR